MEAQELRGLLWLLVRDWKEDPLPVSPGPPWGGGRPGSWLLCVLRPYINSEALTKSDKRKTAKHLVWLIWAFTQ